MFFFSKVLNAESRKCTKTKGPSEQTHKEFVGQISNIKKGKHVDIFTFEFNWLSCRV
jgi:hypothetical protein